jgi:hypothetical protein
MALITLTTDFGHDDAFVAMMKGVILGRCPQARLVDICHTIPAQDIGAASRMLAQAAPFFPAAAIHLAVVDPGVGTRRHLLCLATADQLFLAPDNGLLTPFFDQARRIFCITAAHLFLAPVSATFHGRDILAPAAAALAGGLPPEQLGPAIAAHHLVRLAPPRPTMAGQELWGHCLRADHFGNMTTTISAADLTAFLGPDATPLICCGPHRIQGLSPTYGPASPHPIALINSSNHLEISLPGGHATHTLRLAPGLPVVITRQPGP